ncbi:MAG: glycosyltransferase family 4 protein [Anaerolineae bacterium]|jgi:glycosyltransferase involved in cell wall biosynthesis|nr:glycosyltransferase family 4 protein [Anaerolineae bacterium]
MATVNFYTAMGLNPITGYGRMALGLAKGLDAAGVQVRLYPDPAAPTLVIGFAPAFDAPHIRPTRRTAFTMLESTRPAPEIVAALNAHCEQLLVPAPPMVPIYQQHGVTIPVHYVPLGVDLFPVEPVAAPPDGPFTFLTYSYGDTRKGGEVALNAFLRAFGDHPDYRLIIKARDGYQMGWLAGLQHPRVQVLGGAQQEEDWLRLLQAAHCFVFPSRAEGWGMPPRDATLAGVPTIATEWLGMWDVAHWGLPLPVKELRPCDFRNNPFNADDGLWAEPDEEALIEHMRRTAADYPAALEIARRGRAYLLAQFGWQRIGEQVKTLLTGG